MRDYEELCQKLQEKHDDIDYFIEFGAFRTFLVESFRSINFNEEKEIETLLSLTSFYAASDSSIGATIFPNTVYFSMKYREMKYFTKRQYDKIDNFDLRFEEFAAELVNLYYQNKDHLAEINHDHCDSFDDDIF